ncbi:hypothetical protein Tco_0749391 [Tanacetum coccineum]|uniref:Uncharacterized protein n=1 Tax=Tanacetum coccineum TaxID=301880 RepID=A0ABQ4YZA7_9ASTR
MSGLKFADSHNMVVFLAKPTESEGFEQIVDFLNVNPIKYVFDKVNPQSILHVLSNFGTANEWKLLMERYLAYERVGKILLDSYTLFPTHDGSKSEEMGEGLGDQEVHPKRGGMENDALSYAREADRLLAERLQTKEQEELTDEEKARLFVELLEKIKKHFAVLRAQEKRNKPPTKAQKKSTMSTYLKHMAGYKQSQLKNKSFAEIQKLFDKAMTRVNMFVDMDTELVKKSSKKVEAEKAQESSSKRAEEVAVDAIPLATKPPSIIDWNIIKEGKIGYYQIIRTDGNSKKYSTIIQMHKNFDREDLESLRKLVKAKHGYTRPEEGYKRVLWGDLKTMFEHNVEDKAWRNLLGNKVLIWKLFDSCRVHFVRFQDMHLFMLVKKRYPLTPATITEMLNKKLQTDHLNEICYQLLKLMIKQLKKQ